jgi:hypothetical protein
MVMMATQPGHVSLGRGNFRYRIAVHVLGRHTQKRFDRAANIQHRRLADLPDRNNPGAAGKKNGARRVIASAAARILRLNYSDPA